MMLADGRRWIEKGLTCHRGVPAKGYGDQVKNITVRPPTPPYAEINAAIGATVLRRLDP